MKKLTAAVAVLALVIAAPLARADGEKGKGRENKRAEIDAMAEEALAELLDKSPKAKEMFGNAYGYAVFDNWKFALGLSGGGGGGVAVARESGRRTYMKMGTVGVGLGLGGKKYQVIFLFQAREPFENFIEKGWQADTAADAAAGTAAVNATSTFTNGIAIFQLTEKGLMANADVAGTKYWKNKKLNPGRGGGDEGE